MPEIFGVPATDIDVQTCDCLLPYYGGLPGHVHAPTFAAVDFDAGPGKKRIRVPSAHLSGNKWNLVKMASDYPWFFDAADRGPLATIG